MIKPDKHTDIKYSIIYLSTFIMKEVMTNGVIKFDDLKESLIQNIGKKANENFEHSLSYLFLIGKIEYIPKNDLIKTAKS